MRRPGELGLRGWQDHDDMEAAVAAGTELQAAAVCARDGSGDRETEPGATARLTA